MKNKKKSFYFEDYNHSEFTENKKNFNIVKILLNRVTFLSFIFFALMLIFSIKITYLSLSKEKNFYNNQATNQFQKKRRDIIDRNGSVLATNVTLYDIGILGVVKHSRIPLRFMILIGFLSSLISFGIALFYFIYKLLFWNSFELGIAPLVIGIFIFASIQILLIGIIGEYIGIILLHQRNMPLVIEKERINF